MYRTLLATCGSAEMKIIYLYIKVYEIQNSRSHTLRATCGTFPCNEANVEPFLYRPQ